MQAFYRHAAAYELGAVYSFSLNISADIEARARGQASAAVWLQKRIARELGRLLPNEAPCFWFMIEQVNHYRHLHLHGEIVTDDIAASRKALRLAGGEWWQARQHQVRSARRPDDGWIGYAFKELPYSRNGMFAHLRGFAGEPYASTRNVTQLARSLYETDRQQVLAQI